MFLNCITKTSQATNGYAYVAWGPHVGQPWFQMLLKSEAVYNSSACKFDVLYFVYSAPDTLDWIPEVRETILRCVDLHGSCPVA